MGKRFDTERSEMGNRPGHTETKNILVQCMTLKHAYIIILILERHRNKYRAKSLVAERIFVIPHRYIEMAETRK